MNKPKFTRNDIQATLISAGIEPEQARTLTTRIIETMVTALVTGKVIELRGFGTLEPRTRKARTRHNPRTMAPVDVPARRVIFFRSGEKLKKALNSGHGKTETFSYRESPAPAPGWTHSENGSGVRF